MKLFKCVMLSAVIVGCAALRTLAQDPLAVAPDMYRLLFENERVRVMEVTFQPGQKIASHSHPEHFVYVAEGGKIRMYKPNAPSADVDIQAGQVVWFPAETHWGENIGTTTLRLIVNELKEPAPAKATSAAAPAAAPPATAPGP